MAAKPIEGEALNRIRAPQQNLALHRQTRPGCAKQITRLHAQRRRIPRSQGAIRQAQVKVDPFGQEILDQHSATGQGGRVHIGLHLQPPCPARHRIAQGQGKDMSPRHILGGKTAGVFHPIGPGQDGGDGQAGDRGGAVVTGQNGRMDHLTRAVSAAIRGKEHINRRAGRAAFHPAIRQVKGRIGQRQERDILDARPGHAAMAHHHHLVRGRARAPRQARINAQIALRIGRTVRNHRVGPAQHLDPRAFYCACVGQMPHRHMQPIRAQHRGQAQIGQHEPLRRPRIGIGIGARHPRCQRIDARWLICQHITQRQARDHVAVQRAPRLARPGPDLGRDLRGKAAFLPFGQGAAEVILLHRADQVAVADAPQRQVDPVKVHRLHRHRRIRAARQDIGTPRKDDRRRPVAHIKHLFHIAQQRLATGGRQARAQHDAVTFTVPHTVHTQLIVLRLHRQGCIQQVHERRVILPRLDQRLRELRANPRRGAVALYRIADHAEPVFGHGLLQRAVQIGARSDALRQTQARDHVAPPLRRLQRLRQNLQRAHALRWRIGAQIAVHRSTDRPFPQADLAVIILRLDLPGQARIFHPQITAIQQGHRRPHPPGGTGSVPGIGPLQRGLQDRVRIEAPRRVQRADLQRQIARVLQSRTPQPVQIRDTGRSGLQSAGRRRHHLGRQRARIGAAPLHGRFRKAGIRPGIEGKGRAIAIRQTGGPTGRQRRIEQGLQIATRKIHVPRHDDTSIRHDLLRKGRCGRKADKAKNKGKRCDGAGHGGSS